MQPEERAVAMAHFIQPAIVEAIAQARRWIAAFAGEHGMSAERRANVATALSEAVTNVVRHAYDERGGEVVLAAATDGEWLSVRIADAGCGTESTSLGLGLPLMRELADRVEIGPALRGPGTVVLLEFPVNAGPEGQVPLRVSAQRAEPAPTPARVLRPRSEWASRAGGAR